MVTKQPTERTQWRGGWWSQARHCVSPNFGPRPAGVEVSLLLVHSISLPPGEFGGPYIEALFTNTLDWNAHPYFQTIQGLQVSSHFLIRRTGECVQFVSIWDRAWHAGASSWRGRDNCNDYSVGIELEGLEGEPFESAQYDTLVALSQDVASQVPISDVAGHEHVAPGRKADPGVGFDWNAFLQRVALNAWYFPSSI